MVEKDNENKRIMKRRMYNRKNLGWKEKDYYKPARIYRKLTDKEKDILNGNGISEERYYNRLHEGWNKNKAMNEPLRKYKRISKQEKAWMDESGIDNLTFRTRIARDMDREKAAKMPKKRSKKDPFFK